MKLDQTIIPASTRDLGVDVGDLPFMLPASYEGITGPRRTPRGISAVPLGAEVGTRFMCHLACPKCSGTERVVGHTSDGLRSACLNCKRTAERECQRRRRSKVAAY